ncbi:hypothetical protein Enr13x_56910 [Stieleria neptunia]|uniref:Uncharacterized protein n=1 Tax=Stieleria neptunia TaxID=2527979 RepID=A0A518HY65_9BACT|nr:hypothetical protein [Stieleria neptunia]QDV45790.1 hypothetical protein Enr13x_56910 [Stieleria neptunia]
MDTYIRFQTQLRCCNTGRPAGIFVAAGRIEDRTTLPDATRDRLREVLIWFNRNLTVPALDESDWRCLFWFRSDSQPVIRRLWELAYLLEDEGVFVTKVRTNQPGMIVYRDEHQVAAMP